MPLKLLKRSAIQSLALMFLVITISYAVGQYKLVTISANDKSSETIDERDNLNEGELTEDSNFISVDVNKEDELTSVSEILDKLGERYLMIKKPIGDNRIISIEDLYMTKSINISIAGLYEESLNSEMIGRFHSNEYFYGEPSYTSVPSVDISDVDEIDGTYNYNIIKDFGNDLAHAITITRSYDNTTMPYTTELLIELDHIYVPTLYEDEDYYYIDLKRPKEVYDKVIVIDAGHGGKDSGSISYDQQYYEKDINLSILQHLKVLLDQENIKVYYTRLEEEKVFLKPRVGLANEVNCDFFISIHCNANIETWPKGTEVLYYDTYFNGVKAKDMANVFLEELTNTISLENRGLIRVLKDDIYILTKAEVPAIIIEVGFMSNYEDMQYLLKDENRQLTAQGIYLGILRAYEELQIMSDIQ